MRTPILAAVFTLLSWSALADEISVERGLIVSIVSGCHDCHTEGYRESNGAIDPAKAMLGSSIGWQGPWGTSYPANLRRVVSTLTEDGFVNYAKAIQTNPPMPWYNLRKMPEDDARSLYRYLLSLGDQGEQAPTLVPTGERVKTPYIVLEPPQLPPPCTRDLDCGIGEICGTSEPRQCVAK
jgi:hypothetical protein